MGESDEFTLSAVGFAASDDKVKHYAILVTTESGDFKFSRDGNVSTIIGMLEIMKHDLVGGLVSQLDVEPESDEDRWED